MAGLLIFLYLAIVVVWIVIMKCMADRFQRIAEKKGSTERFWAWCFWLFPIGAAMVIALPDRGAQAAQQPTADGAAASASAKENADLPEL